MASIPLCKNLIFIKCLGFSAGTSLHFSHEKSVFVDPKAIFCREESCGSDIENKWVLILWTPSGWSIMSIRVIS